MDGSGVVDGADGCPGDKETTGKLDQARRVTMAWVQEKEVNEMPAGDGTGPMGMGRMTGRGAGYCSGYDAPGWANPAPGRGYGLSWGRGAVWGRGRVLGGRGGGGWRHRNWYYATGVPGWARFGSAPGWGAPAAPYWGYEPAPSRGEEIGFLKQQAAWLKQGLDEIGRRIDELTQEE